MSKLYVVAAIFAAIIAANRALAAAAASLPLVGSQEAVAAATTAPALTSPAGLGMVLIVAAFVAALQFASTPRPRYS